MNCQMKLILVAKILVVQMVVVVMVATLVSVVVVVAVMDAVVSQLTAAQSKIVYLFLLFQVPPY